LDCKASNVVILQCFVLVAMDQRAAWIVLQIRARFNLYQGCTNARLKAWWMNESN
jgi:hypothetical protein